MNMKTQSLDKDEITNQWIITFQLIDNPLITYVVHTPKIKHKLNITIDLDTIKYLYEEL